jgi:CrcB protein
MRAGRAAPILAVALGGAVGAVARHGLAVAVPHRAGEFPWATLVTNLAGCVLIGALMVLLTETTAPPHRLVRPFLGVGVLGGFTTFSTYAVEVQQLLETGHPWVAAAYLTGTVTGALAAVQVGIVTARVIAQARRRKGSG